MKPINDKERTIAYFQFLALSILFIVVWTVAVFFDYRIKAKDYEVLKIENKILKNTLITSSDLHAQIDSLIGKVGTFGKMSETEYDEQRKRFVDDLKDLLMNDAQDTSELSKIKVGVYKLFKEWTYSIASVIRESNKNLTITKKDEEIKALKEKYDQLFKDFEQYRFARP